MGWRSVENSYSNWFRLRYHNVKYKIFGFFAMPSYCVEAEILPNVTSNTTAVFLSITSDNVISWKVTSESGTVWSSFDFVIPIIVALVLSAINLISSFFKSKLLMFMCRKCKPFLLSGSHIVELISEDF